MPVNQLFETLQFKWIDILDLKQEEIPSLSSEYSINPLLLEDCIAPNHLPKFEDIGNLKFYLTRFMHSSNKQHLNSISDVSTKLGIFLRDDLIVTVHRIENPGIKLLLKEINDKNISDLNPYKIALALGKKIFKFYEEENNTLVDLMDNMEDEIFTKSNSDTFQLKRLYRFKRRVGLNYKVLNLSSEWVNSFDRLPLNSVELKDLKESYKDALNNFDHLNIQITNIIGLFIALSDQKANQVMKLLAIYSVYFLPISFIAGLYGMNFINMPELHQPLGYFITLGVMLLIVLTTFLYFRAKKW